MPVFMLEPNLDRLAVPMMMQRMSDEIGDMFLRLKHETSERFNGRSGRRLSRDQFEHAATRRRRPFTKCAASAA